MPLKLIAKFVLYILLRNVGLRLDFIQESNYFCFKSRYSPQNVADTVILFFS